MALNADEKKRLDKLDFAMGGGFSDFITDRQKLNPSNSKFLFIGLGGKGSKTVAGIKTEVYKKIKCNEKKKRPDNFEYLVIDTDMESMEHLVKGGFGEVGLSDDPTDFEACQLYDAKAAKLLKPGNRKLIPNYISEWLSPTMNQTLQGKGAGGIRQAGRYLLFGTQAFGNVKNALVQKLGNLHAQIIDSDKEELIVYIFAGVSGGTGSGTVIDIPYIIREICAQKNWTVKLYGYIFLPDTYPETATGNHLKYNAYAALKEIDTLMNIGTMDGSMHFRATYVPGFTVDSVENIFDSCVLVSGKKDNGGLVKNPDGFSRQVVIDNIVNLVTENTTSNGFLANSFLDNSPTEIQNKVDELSEKSPRNANYQYTVIGTGTMVMPFEQIMAYMAHGTMEMLERAWDKHAEQKHVESLLGKINMLPQTIANDIMGKSKVPLMQYVKGIGGFAKKEDVITDSLFHTIKQYWMAQNVALYDAWDVAKNQCLERIVTQLSEEYASIFKDPVYGLYFLKELFSFRVIDGNEINGILFRLENEYKPSIEGFVSAQEQMQVKMDEDMRKIKGELESIKGILPNRLIEEYREICVAKLVSENMVEMYATYVRDCLNQIITFIEGKTEELQKYIDVVTYMKDVVDRNYRCVMDGTMPQAEYAGKLMDFSDKTDDATEQVIAYLDAMLAAKEPEGVVSTLEANILTTEKNWVHSEEDFNPMRVFVEFLESQYQALPNLTLEKFFAIKYGADGVDKGMNAVCTELESKAKVIFSTREVLSLDSLFSQQYVVIPAGAQKIGASMAAFAKTKGAEVVTSVDMNSMYWYNLKVGVPLYALVDMESYEKLYEENNVSGMHIWETAEDNWKEFPSLTNQSLWSTPNFNPRERKYTEELQQNLKHFLECGIVVFDEKINMFYAYCLADGDESVLETEILKWCEEDYLQNPEINEDGIKSSNHRFFERLREEKNFTKYLINLSEVYMTVTEENLYQMVRMNVFLYRKMLDTYRIYQKCQERINLDNSDALEKKKKQESIKRFNDYVRCGIILLEQDSVILERENGEQEEIMYFNDYTQIENQFYVFYAAENFRKRYDEETLAELDEYAGEILNDKLQETRERRKKNGDTLMEECERARESLKKTATKKQLSENMVGELDEFYDAMLRLRTGK